MNFVNRFIGVVAMLLPFSLAAQTISSVSSGFWDDPLTWSGGVVPTAINSSAIQVLGTHVITIRTTVMLDGVVINPGGAVIVSAAGSLQLYDGIGTDISISGSLEVYGILERGNATTISSSPSSLVFHSGSIYRHLYTTQEGSLPLASWDTQSTITINGYTTANQTTATGNWNQSFGNLIWDTPALTSSFNLLGRLAEVKGDLTIMSTGSQQLIFSSTPASEQIVVQGDFIITGSARVDLINSSGTFKVKTGDNVVIDTNGVLNLASQGIGTIEPGKDVVIVAGTVSETGSATGEFLFDNARIHKMIRGANGSNGAFSGKINYVVSASDTLDLGVSVLSPGVGNGNGNTLQVMGTIMVGSLDINGAVQSNTTAGNIRTTVANRIFSPGCKIIYNGQASQFMGNAGAASSTGTQTVIDNSLGVTVATNTTLTGSLMLKNGLLLIPATTSLTLSGDVITGNGFLDGTATSSLIISDSVDSILNLTLNPSPITLGSLTIDRRAQNASVTLMSSLTVISQLNLLAGDLINNNKIQLQTGSTIVRWTRGRLLGQRIHIDAGNVYNVTYRTSSGSLGPFAKIETGLELPDVNAQNDLNILNVTTAQSSDTVELSQDITINSLLDLNRGRFFASNHTIDFRGPIWSDDTGNFGYGSSVVIFSDSTSIQGSSNSNFNSIRATPAAKLRFGRGTTIFGNIDFQPGSTIYADNITMTFSGSQLQNVSASGATVGNITMTKSNSSTVQLLSPLSMKGLLRFNSPSTNINFKSDGFLTLLSSMDTIAPFTSAGIYRLQNGNTVSGNITVQRFISGEGRIYRYISSPVAGAMIDSWKDDFAITGNFQDPSSGGSVCGALIIPTVPSLYYFDETIVSGNNSGYVSYPQPGQLSSNSSIDVGRGYAAFIRQCTVPTSVDVSGPINQQQINLPVTFTPGSSFQGWNLVGNPYPCSIDWDTGGTQGWIKTNISPTIAVRDNGAGGFFRYWDGDGDPSGIPEGRIAPGQGFWIRTTGANPVLAVREGVKVTQGSEFYREKTQQSPSIVLSLTHNGYEDRAYIKTKPQGEARFDSLDCPKLDNVLFDISTLSTDSVSLAINVVNSMACSGSLAVMVSDVDRGIYRLDIQSTQDFDEYDFTLYDQFTRTEDLLNGNGYEFVVTSDPKSALKDRFILNWKPKISWDGGKLVDHEYLLCENKSIKLEVAGAKSGTCFEIWDDETFISHSLELNSSQLHVGDHFLQVKEIGKCRSRIVDSLVVHNQRPAVLEVDHSVICIRGSATLSAQADDPKNSICWYSTRTSHDILAVSNTFVTPPLEDSHTYYVSARTIDGCESKRLAVDVEVLQFTPVVIERIGNNVLGASYHSGNRWYQDGTLIEEERGQFIFVSEPGVYSVRNHYDECVTEASYNFDSKSVADFLVYPNPVQDVLVIEGNLDAVTSIDLYDATGVLAGNLIPQSFANEKLGIFEVANLKSGFYILKVISTDRSDRVLGLIKK